MGGYPPQASPSSFFIPPIAGHSGYKKKSGHVWKGVAEHSGHSTAPLVFKKLKFKGSSIEGKGKDHQGKYKVHGSISHNHAQFQKTYKSSHVCIMYDGSFNPNGQIVGRWQQGGTQGGQFYINQDYDSSSSSDSD